MLIAGLEKLFIIIIIIIIYSSYRALIPNGPKALYIIKKKKQNPKPTKLHCHSIKIFNGPKALYIIKIRRKS